MILLHSDKSCPDLNPYMLKFFSDARELLNHIEQNINNEKIQKKMSKGKEKHIEWIYHEYFLIYVISYRHYNNLTFNNDGYF